MVAWALVAHIFGLTLWVSGLLVTFKHVTVIPTKYGGTMATNFRYKNCPFQVLVDGLPTSQEHAFKLSPKELAGIEVYLGAATIPLQYKRLDGATCGLIMIWTREGS